MSVPAEQVPTYDFGTALRDTTNRLYPVDNYGLRDSSGEVSAAPQMGGTTEPVKFSDTLMMAAKQKGGSLTPEEIESIRQAYLNDKLIPALWKEKGMTQSKAEALQGVFANRSQRTIDAYLSSLKANGQSAAANEANFGLRRTLRGISDTAATTATSAVGGVTGGVLSLADLGVRGVEKMAGGEGEKTWLGNLADAVDRGTQAVDRALVSDETLQTRQQFYQMLNDPKVSADEVVAFVGKNPSALTGVLGNTLGLMTPAGLLRIPKLARVIKALDEGGRIARAAGKAAPIAITGLPITGQAAGDFQRQIDATPLADLRQQTPENEQLYQQIASTGLPPATVEKTFKEKLAMRGVGTILATSALANIAFPGLNPLAVEKQIAGTIARTGSRLRRVTQSALAEGTEEGLASAVETAGQNIATNQATGQDIPADQNIGKNVLLGAGLGAAIGGAVGIPGGKPGAPENLEVDGPFSPANIEATMRAGGIPATPSAAPTAAPTQAPTAAPIGTNAGKGIDDTAMPAVLVAATRLGQTTAANGRSAAGKGVKNAKDAQDIVSRATVLASTVPNFEKLNVMQQLMVVETIANEFTKKAANVNEADVVAHLNMLRDTLNPPGSAPEKVTETPTPEGLLTTPPQETPAPVEAAPTVEATAPPAAEQPPVSGPVVSQPTDEETKTKAQLKILAALPSLKPEQLTTPELKAVKAAFDAGIVKDVPTLRAFIENGYKMPEAAPVPTPPQKRGLRKKPAEVPATAPESAPAAVPPPPAKRGKGLKTASPAPAQEAAPTTETKPTVPKPPSKRGLKKGEESPPPKTTAPAPIQEAGAQVNETSAPKSDAGRETAEQAVKRILKESIAGEDEKDAIAALELSRLGDTGALEAWMKDAEIPDGDIGFRKLNKAERSALREAGKSLSPAERGEADVPPTEAPYIENESPQEEARRVKDNIEGKNAREALAWVADNGPTPYYRLLAKTILTRLDQLEKAGVKFKLTFADLSATREAGRTLTLRDLKKGYLSTEVILDTDTNSYQAGAHFQTVLHEYLHAVTSTIQRTYEEGLVDVQHGAIIKAARNLRALYDAVSKVDFTDIVRGTELEGTNFLANEREFLAWGMTNPTFQAILKQVQMPGSTQTVWSKFVSTLRSMLGLTAKHDTVLDYVLDAGADILTGDLDQWMRAVSKSGNFKNTPEFAQTTILSDSLQKKDNRPVPVSAMQRIGETMANSTYGLEKAEQAVRKAGDEVPPELSPMYAGRKYTSDIPQIVNVDIEEVVKPIAAYIQKNWAKFANSPEAFRKNSDLFFQYYHQLTERLPDLWLQTVPLNNGQNMARELLIDAAHEGKISKQDFYKQLQQLVNANASQTFDEWTKTTGKVYDVDKLRTELAILKKKGYDENTMAEYNAMFKPVRDRIQEHMLASGRIAPNDPWVEGRNWQWYFPLKGTAIAEDVADNDYGTYKGYTKAFRSRALEVMEGRKTQAGSVAEQIISDLTHEGTKRAEASFKETLFGFVQQYKHLLGKTDITIISGTPKQGFTKTILLKNPKTGKLEPKEVSVPASAVFKEPPNGFVYHNGDTHFRVRFDLGSETAMQLDRGLKGFNNVQSWKHPVMKGLSVATNLMARGYTTYSPEWQFFVGYARDINYIPAMVAVQEFKNPLKAGQFTRGYAKRVLANTLNISNLKQALAEIQGNHSKLRTMAKDNEFLQKLAAYRAAGGSTEFSQSLNSEAAYDILFGKAKSNVGAKGKALNAYRNINEWTSNWAQLLENKGRVAAWDTLVTDLGYTPEHAAAVVKGVMDFGQSGEWGRKINALIAFYRVGATGSDAIRRAFTTPTGKADWPKLRNWSGFFAGLGALAYMSMAAMLGDDEDGKPRMKKYDIHTLTQKLIIPTGDGNVVGYPIGLGLPQLLMAPGIIGSAYLNGHITEKEAANELYDVYNRNAPIQPGGWAEGTGTQGFITSWLTGALPTVTRPLQETTYNVNAFDAPIHSQWKDKTKYRSDQGMQATPQQWKDMATELRKMTGGLVDMFPEDIRHLAKGYLGQPMADVSRWTMDLANKENQGLDSQAVRTSLRIGVQDEDFYYTRELNRTLDKLYVTQRRYKNTEDDPQARSQFNSDPDNLRRMAALKTLEKAKKAYYKQITEIRESNASVEGRRYARKRADSALRQAVEGAQRVVESTD